MPPGVNQITGLEPSRRSVLVVDADPTGLSSTAAILEKAGYDVTKVSEFAAARRHLAAAPPAVLVTDVRLGAFNGLHLIVQSRMASPRTAAILTHHAFDPVLQTEAGHHDAAFLLKPCNPEQLLEVVAHSIQHR